ncbi:bifunctional DNA primase/polymerase [Streptomyces sp. NBC_00841]|uniref:bifunctional DNA primase/polymerase n=1 Tax=unclassified Streptomyces TaxID=2593676 RepID=UPI00224F505A|nr:MULTISPECIES: bifunctional DNA primase/polymerase [unclassified Streptomyces]MCX4536949.1 bifunctional DNA primase/polymerase [Streptomyces sp. NBC_01669]WRZ97799.1 bifunctional DNA primase/polymerase [Streptomyces sp. NBC_00841]
MKRMTWRDFAWLSEAADDPSACLTTWASNPRAPYMLPTGRFFDVVSVDQRVGIEALDQLLRRRRPFGPIVLDHRAGRMGFILASQSWQDFAHQLARGEGAAPAHRYLSHGSVVVVPGPQPVLGDRYEWLRAPTRRPSASPLLPVALAAVLVASAEVLTCADRYGEIPRPTPALAPAALEGVWAHAG